MDSGFGEQSVRVFDWACDAMEMTRLVELESENPFTLGRAYCCGTSNTGLYPATDSVKEMYYGTYRSSAEIFLDARRGAALP